MLLAANLIGSNEPVLGLDLQGGISVVLSAEEGATAEDLDGIRDLIRDELEGRGIAEPDVRIEGENVIVDLPGVRDQREALEAVDVAGIVQLRPLVQPCTPPVAESVSTSEPAAAESERAGGARPCRTRRGRRPPRRRASAGVERRRHDGRRRRASRRIRRTRSRVRLSRPRRSRRSRPQTSEPGPTTTTRAAARTARDQSRHHLPADAVRAAAAADRRDDHRLPSADGLTCIVGPVELGPTGESGGQLFARGSASAVLDPAQGWIVRADLTPEGRGTFNQLAQACFTQQQNCPLGALAIVLDDVVQSAPVVQEPNFPDTISISGSGAGAFAESEASSLARVLDRGAFPVQVRTESVQTVSPTLGEDSLRAAIFAGLVGLVLVLLGLMYFYRRLIVVAMAGLAVWALLIYSASAIISQTTNYALSLAGVTGIIVAIGITVDSYVVFFERLKEEVRHGRTVRNSALRSFKATWRTIVAADLVSLIAAAVLFGLSVGSVRGFALYLGVTTVCDLIVCWFFTRPAVLLLADNGWLDEGDTFGLKDYEALPEGSIP